MPNGGAIPPVKPDELLYRRVQATHYNTAKSSLPEHVAFRPNEHDTDGLSFARASMVDPRSVAIGPNAKPGIKYFVGVIRASRITELNLTLATDDILLPPGNDPPDPAHVTIPELNATVRREPKIIDIARKLSQAVETVLGPFVLDDPQP